MSRWESNATWLELRACILSRKGPKSWRHVALEESDVTLGLQRDVAPALFPRKKIGRLSKLVL